MLEDLRVLDLTTEIAGPYCTKMLADAGADVVKVEPAGGDLLRRWRSGALYEFLNGGKRAGEHASPAEVDVLVANELGDLDELWRANPTLVVVTITPFGCTGPWVDRPATEFTLQAAAGSTGGRGLPDQPPLAAGGRLGEFLAGTYAAVAGLAAARESARSGVGEHVDVAMLDCMTVTMATYPSVFAEFLGWPDESGPSRSVEVPSIEPTKDGYVNFTTNSRAQYEAFLLLIGRPDLLDDDDLANARHRFRRRDEFLAHVHAHTTAHTTAAVLEQAAALRVPAGEVFNGATVTGADHFVERGVYVPSASGRFLQPRVPYRIHEPDPLDFSSRTRPQDGFVKKSRETNAEWRLPLAGVRVVDCTAWWAGPAAGHLLACLGADVVKVESVNRPDLMRYSGTRTPPADRWWEWGPIFHAVNVNKRGITLDLTNPEAVEVFHRLLATADVLIENNTPRVMEQFGLTWDAVHARHPQLVMARLPAFGLDGPWRDRPGFAQTMEALSGMAWVTGFPDGPPVLVRGACDPLAAAHAIFGLLVALDRRAELGEGLLLEATMVEAALNVAAEQVFEYQLTGEVLARQGGRGPGAAPQGVYRCAGNDRWLAIAVASDDQWKALRAALGDPAWAASAHLATDTGRRGAHDAIDAELSAWCADQEADALAGRLCDAGVPAAVVVRSRDAAHNPQLRHRGLFEVEEHPVTGAHELPTMPFRFTHVDRWLRFPSPTLGQHNDDLLDEIGVDADERARLRAAGLIGERPLGV